MMINNYSQITSKCYFKYQESIKAYKKSDYELTDDGLLLPILIDQQIEIDGLKRK